jgi:glycosyltransferase involved in cell wall biosynthesis
VQANSLCSRLLLRVERRAYAVADCVVVDTNSNAEFYSRLFSLPLAKFVSAPLATNEIDYQFVPYEPVAQVCHVLFIGTLIPLHGLEAILGAAELLKGRPEIRFTIIGDGQEAPKIEAAMAAGLDNLTWTRAWMNSTELASAIAGADICLGVFGGGDKAQRVCPYKIYGYASVGRAVVTGSTDWLQAASADFGQVPFSGVKPMDSDALAAELLKLAADPGRRVVMARRSRLFYEEFLQNSKGDIVVEDCLMARTPAGQHTRGMAPT